MEENMKETAVTDDAAATAENTEAPKKKKTKISEADYKALVEERDKLIAECKEKDEKHLRMAAEYDNFRRRSREEKEGTYNSAMADTVAELLPIIDNLERAVQFEDGNQIKDGLKMIYSSIDSALAKLGVEAYGQPGDKFDPNLHNAVMHEEDDSGRENEITDIFQRGYKKGNRIIRFAMVKTVN